jgi:hypothetical protein
MDLDSLKLMAAKAGVHIPEPILGRIAVSVRHRSAVWGTRPILSVLRGRLLTITSCARSLLCTASAGTRLLKGGVSGHAPGYQAQQRVVGA